MEVRAKKSVLLLARDVQHAKNWLKAKGFQTTDALDKFRFVDDETEKFPLSIEGECHFVIISSSHTTSRIANGLDKRGYTELSTDIDTWPVDMFVN